MARPREPEESPGIGVAVAAGHLPRTVLIGMHYRDRQSGVDVDATFEVHPVPITGQMAAAFGPLGDLAEWQKIDRELGVL